VARSSGESVVVEMEDAVKLLVEHLVLPALPHGRLDLEEALMPEKQETLARQVRIGFSVAICGVAGVRVGCSGVLREGFRGVVGHTVEPTRWTLTQTIQCENTAPFIIALFYYISAFVHTSVGAH
jgi:hypothetical protein